MRLCALASGSKGNSLTVRSAAGTLVIVDLGLAFGELRLRAADAGEDVRSAAAVLVTHDHSDHCCGLRAFRKNCPETPVWANSDTSDAIAAKTGVCDGWSVFETAVPFAVGDFRITPFSVPHDAADPVGYLLCDGISTLFVGTDIGTPTENVRNALSRCDCAVLESNHDPVLLSNSSRPLPLKQRIAGRSGHLSNEDAADLVRSAAPVNMKHLLLAHLSEECNSPSLAEAAMRRALADCALDGVALDVLSQNGPNPVVEF